jgi:hypothetical protein
VIDDEAFEAIAASLAAMARSRPPHAGHAATLDQVDLISQLLSLARQLQTFCAGVIVDGVPVDRWGRLADLLADASRVCRHQVVLDMPRD